MAWHKEFIKRCLLSDVTINDAVMYGVTIEPAAVQPGQPYYKILGIKHLTPQENGGNRHAYLDVLDESGQRLFGARLLVVNNNIRSLVTVDKPVNEPGGNAPMHWGDTLDISVIGYQDVVLPSDTAKGFHTRHPDESDTRNSLGHHSFYLVAQRVISGPVVPKPTPGPQPGPTPTPEPRPEPEPTPPNNLHRFVVLQYFAGPGWTPVYQADTLALALDEQVRRKATGAALVNLMAVLAQ